MRDERFEAAVAAILRQDQRYPAKAYSLMPTVIDYTLRHLPAQAGEEEHSRPQGHVSGRQLALGFRDYLLAEYGPFAAELLDALNIHATDDIGNIVYNLIAVGLFGKTQQDSLSDFHALYDFPETFRAPYLPLKD